MIFTEDRTFMPRERAGTAEYFVNGAWVCVCGTASSECTVFLNTEENRVLDSKLRADTKLRNADMSDVVYGKKALKERNPWCFCAESRYFVK